MKPKVKKLLAIAAIIALTVAIAAISSVAYLTDSTTTMTNTFATEPNLAKAFVLNETNAIQQPDYSYKFVDDTEPKVQAVTYDIIPGFDLPKDPTVRITEISDTGSYLYLEVCDGLTASSALSFDMDTCWETISGTGLHGGRLFIYKPVGAGAGNYLLDSSRSSEVAAINIIKDKVIHVPSKDAEGNRLYVLGLKDEGNTLDFYAYLCQAQSGELPANVIARSGFLK